MLSSSQMCLSRAESKQCDNNLCYPDADTKALSLYDNLCDNLYDNLCDNLCDPDADTKALSLLVKLSKQKRAGVENKAETPQETAANAFLS